MAFNVFLFSLKGLSETLEKLNNRVEHGANANIAF